MSYIGSTPTTQSFIAGTDYFSGTGSQTAFTLSRSVVSVNDIQATVNNVVQVPNDAYTVSGTTITFTSAPSAGTNNVYVRYLSTTTQAITPSQNTVSWNTLDSNVQGDLGISFKNRIINGNMVIDQRNAGASVTITSGGASTYTLDRWNIFSMQASKLSAQQNAGSVTPPTGFRNYLGLTSLSSYSVLTGDTFALIQIIEGFNVADLNWGTANAQTVTLSFWVRSSLTGTFGGSLVNNGGDRSYPFSYTISAANTWTKISVTIVGDTSGTWLTNNGAGLGLRFGLGSGATFSGTAGAWAAGNFVQPTGTVSVVGTNGATFYITGVQLEVGTQATTFTTAGGSYGAELALCQRYCLRVGDGLTGVASTSNNTYLCPSLTNPMRASPTTTLWDNSVKISDNYAADFTSSGSTLVESSLSAFGGRISINGFTGLTVGRVYQAYGNSDGYVFILSAEL
jgi:hypothetical protein